MTRTVGPGRVTTPGSTLFAPYDHPMSCCIPNQLLYVHVGFGTLATIAPLHHMHTPSEGARTTVAEPRDAYGTLPHRQT